ncbi:hypothetical protein EVAR_3401_1 [Eumeta japonica]|uniref:Uncharacterized protein n=1 Tax=Eumeta variegata TaxID=151549 RepID=A0A4C1SV12_EUMVA|nr:hypothetical protein EVAR_3401_1 [Eumeta japonica]
MSMHYNDYFTVELADCFMGIPNTPERPWSYRRLQSRRPSRTRAQTGSKLTFLAANHVITEKRRDSIIISFIRKRKPTNSDRSAFGSPLSLGLLGAALLGNASSSSWCVTAPRAAAGVTAPHAPHVAGSVDVYGHQEPQEMTPMRHQTHLDTANGAERKRGANGAELIAGAGAGRGNDCPAARICIESKSGNEAGITGYSEIAHKVVNFMSTRRSPG